MASNPPSKRLRAAASTACYQCKAAKKRCEGDTPCDSCIRRGLSCTRPPADIPDSRIRLSFEDPETTGSGKKYMVDVHSTLYDSTAKLLDRDVYS
ncbi:uncharacterized protein N7483_001600 [Penicillium malachiteum]|uniref:uncharacterized protein n=1 Tax=Penicillium malachiteum TaxID=1324776 RepID=UPI002549A9AB|nr:uncharacterized protein N7483_001600 [Penicillium malachiteum]KAJ5736475.1 hypothetical protein N7483_001600 [Penicillium malachiteum]